ncbi:MAG: caspase family protein [Dehalococcoidales bacterium]
MKSLFSKISIASFLALVMLLVSSFAVPCVQVQAASTPTCWGVFVGLADYQNFYGPTYSDDNARELSQDLSPAWGSSHVRLLTNSQATKSAVLTGIDWLADNTGPDDTAFFYFSGFGDSRGYVLPYDSLTSSYANDISTTDLANAFQSVRAGKIVIMLQCSFAGAFENALAGYGRVLIFASRSNESSYYDSSLRHSIFTYYVLQAFTNFTTADSNHDSELTAEELYDYAGPLTTQYEIDHGYSSLQHPVLSDRYSGGLPLVDRFTFATNISLPSGTTILTLDGVNYTSVPSPKLWAPGSSHTVTVPQAVSSGSGTRYSFTGWNDGSTAITRTVSSGALTANYNKEYLLTVSSAYGTPTGDGWYAADSVASFSISSYIETSNTKRYFTSWSGGYTGTSAAGTLAMNGPKTVTANWRSEYLLAVNSAFGNPAGGGWYADGASATFSVTNYVETSNTKHYFTNWSGDFNGTGASSSLVMSAPKTVTANWRHEYLLTINSEYGTPTGAGWYQAGTKATVAVETTQGFLIRHIFTGWNGDLTSTQPSADVTMSAPKVITATWKSDFMQLYILIGIVVVLAVAITVTVVILRGKKTPTFT